MIVDIRPSELKGTAAAPPSKSWAHRLLISAGLSEGVSRVSGLAPSQDVLATCDCLRALGAEIEFADGTAVVKGTDPARAEPAVLSCRESGSTLRFFIPLCALSGQEMTLSGSRTLLTRPLSVYEEIFVERGLELSKTQTSVRVKGVLPGGRYSADGNISSQFISGLLFALPLADEDSVISLRPPVESRAYIDITIAALARYGVKVCWQDENTLAVPGRQKYTACDSAAEGDWSNAAFFLAMGLEVSGVDRRSLQGDRVCEEYFRKLDQGRAELDISGCPDLGPVLMAYAALHSGAVLTGTARLKVKESDRGTVMKEELAKFGVDVDIEDNRITVGSGLRAPDDTLDGHNDHRIVMSMAVLCLKTGGTIEGAEAVSKSFPDFFDRLAELGGDITVRRD